MKTTKRQADDIEALRQLKDEEINLTDIPPLKDWKRAVVGKFYRPRKEPLTIRIDADVLAQLKAQGKGYQTRINRILRQAVDKPAPRAIQIRITEIGVWPRKGVQHGH